MPYESEWQTRKKRIDSRLKALGWTIRPFSDKLNLGNLTATAVEELPTKNGPADYGLFVGGHGGTAFIAKALGDIARAKGMAQVREMREGRAQSRFRHDSQGDDGTWIIITRRGGSPLIRGGDPVPLLSPSSALVRVSYAVLSAHS